MYAVEIGNCRQPILALRVDAAEEHTVLEDQVDAQRSPVDLHCLRSGVDPEHARDSAAAELPEGLRHQMRIAGRFDHEVECPELRQVVVSSRDVPRAGVLDEVVARLERCGPHFHVRQAQEACHQQTDRACADHQRSFELPWLPPADRASMSECPLADRRRFREHPEPAQ